MSAESTHDSAAFTRTLTPFVQTQTLNFTQNYAGIRFFDLRVNFVPYLRPPDLLLQLVHGSADLGIILKDVFQEIYGWLDAHIGEAVFVSLPAPMTMANFTDRLFDLINQEPDYWRKNTDIPKMSHLKFTSGPKQHDKIQLIRRFDLAYQVSPNDAGLDMTNWDDNSDRCPIVAGPPNTAQNFIVQDHYGWVYADGDTALVLGKKYKVVNSLTIEAASPTNVWYFNYISAVRASLETSLFKTTNPFHFAHGTYDADPDPTFIKGEKFRIYTFLKAATTPKSYGVLMFDFPTDSEASKLVFQVVQNHTFRP